MNVHWKPCLVKLWQTEDKLTRYSIVQKMLLTFTSVITATAVGASFYIVSLPEPTEAQTNLANTTNAIAIAGTTALFSLLDDDQNNSSKS